MFFMGKQGPFEQQETIQLPQEIIDIFKSENSSLTKISILRRKSFDSFANDPSKGEKPLRRRVSFCENLTVDSSQLPCVNAGERLQQYVMEQGLDIDGIYTDGQVKSSLLFFAYQYNAKICFCWLAELLDPVLPNLEQQTAFHLMVKDKRYDWLTIIDSYPKSLHIMDAKGQTPIDLAIQLQDLKAFEMLFYYFISNPVSNEDRCRKVVWQALKIPVIARFLLTITIQFNFHGGSTQGIFARGNALTIKKNLMELFIQYREQYWNFALSNNSFVLDLLALQGNMWDGSGNTPLHYLAKIPAANHETLVPYLVARISPSIKNMQMKTPFSLAIEATNSRFIKYMLVTIQDQYAKFGDDFMEIFGCGRQSAYEKICYLRLLNFHAPNELEYERQLIEQYILFTARENFKMGFPYQGLVPPNFFFATKLLTSASAPAIRSNRVTVIASRSHSENSAAFFTHKSDAIASADALKPPAMASHAWNEGEAKKHEKQNKGVCVIL
jgi:hypothetical protein